MTAYVSSATLALWISVTPATISTPAPTVLYDRVPGSVQPDSWRKAKPVETCPLLDQQGRVVGFSMCEGKK